MIYDVARQEEKLIMREFSRRGIPINPMNMNNMEMHLLGSWSQFGLTLMRAMSHMKAILIARILNINGVPTINDGEAMELAWNKALTLAILGRAGLPVTPSTIIMDGEPNEASYPAILKPIQGSWGRMTSMIRNREELMLVLKHRSAMDPHARPALLQPLIGDGTDYRVFVIGGEAVAGMRRRPPNGDWRSNVARGGRAEAVRIDPIMGELAAKAVELLGLEYAGVDFLASDELLINEVNAVPEFRGLMHATGVDIPGLLVNHVINSVKR